MIREGFSEEVAFVQRYGGGERVSHVGIWGMSIPGRGNSKYKGPEMSLHLASWKDSKASVGGTECGGREGRAEKEVMSERGRRHGACGPIDGPIGAPPTWPGPPWGWPASTAAQACGFLFLPAHRCRLSGECR